MAKLTASEVTAKHARNLKNSIEDIRKGVERVTESPTKKAAQKIDKMVANWNKAVQSGKLKAGLERVTAADWQEKMLTKGVNRISQGIDEASAKMEDFYGQLLPFIDGVQKKVNAMPDLTLEDSINKMVTNAREMAKFKRR